jgi:hypothetical protein
MTKRKCSKTKIHLRPAEELVPREDWFSFFKKVSEDVHKELGTTSFSNGYRHDDATFWDVLVYCAINGKATQAGSDELNDRFYEQKGKSRQCVDLKRKRYERLVPNAQQVNHFLQRIRTDMLDKFQVALIKAQVFRAIEMGLITKVVEVYIDFHKIDYYGKDRRETNDGITNVNDGRGTNRARKYGEVMISSGLVSLFAGASLTKQGAGKEAWIGKLILMLRFWGFTIKRIYGDREFSTYDVLALLDMLDVPYTGSMKKSQGIRDVIDKYLDGECKSVVYHALQPSQFVRLNVGSIPIHVILKTDAGTTIHALRNAINDGTMTHAKAREKIHVFITTEQEPADSSKLIRWGHDIIDGFRRRWRIESGFRDSKKFRPMSHARSNAIKTFKVGLGNYGYNGWRIQTSLYKRLQNVPKSWRQGETRERFATVVTTLHVKSLAAHGLNNA